MADAEPDEVEDTGYKAPAQKSVAEMTELDKDDEALNRWKAQLLGGAKGGGEGPPVTVQRMVVVGPDKLDLKGPPKELSLILDDEARVASYKEKAAAFTFQEAADYCIKVEFTVNKEVVSGLKLINKVKRKGIKVDTQNFMFGSYGAKEEGQCAYSSVQDVPKGMLARGFYTVNSKFIDDDKMIHAEWDWCFHIKKTWE
mmetsp:Transcript_19687/g.58689  ORF Transcript_19687/g.58689 Transcript_19687/m.58689 type:complete len:199 (+) Transcript_19687:24-620(+)